MEEIHSLIKELKSYDNKEGYRQEYQTVTRNLEPTIKRLIQIGEPALGSLHDLIKQEETWSCLFALEILRGIKSEKSIPFLIEFLVLNEDRDYWEACEEAMFALNNIGKPAIKPLIAELKKQFDNKRHLIYLVGSLTEIVDDEVHDFMLYYTEQYLKNPSEYKDWFLIDGFTHDFSKQGKGDVLPILKRTLELDHIPKHVQME